MFDDILKKDNKKTTKPPLGIVPKKLHREIRFNNICDAMRRYKKAGKVYPQEWVDEYDELYKYLKSVNSNILYKPKQKG